ncbi:hypothetical protein CMQ_4520 [Grosmannia clavigera kw1407]|uniref:Uncharacterized protein n=1 Tax=Grosmannia clavigera (strain kw1407 / UAMH 11150) TaxID=655863 RepID=F0XUF3_GROCL|nr:uncharacterized protein CMQ_4520 [Grosmannia clavigera kw1407]EFW98668.1 hypothetical protein CMQ_4520 [Grosmannia clavigera kw1407]
MSDACSPADPSRPDGVEFEIVSSEGTDLSSTSKGQEPTPKDQGAPGSWARPYLTTMMQLATPRIRYLTLPTFPSWKRWMEQMRAKQPAKTPEGGLSIFGNLTRLVYNPRVADNKCRVKVAGCPLILLNGSFIVGKSAVARDLAYILGNRYKARMARSGRRLARPAESATETQTDGCTVVLHMNEIYNTTVNGIPKPSVRRIAGNVIFKTNTNTDKSCEHQALWPSTETKAEFLEKMRTIRNQALLDHVISENHENKTVIISDCLLFSKESAETVQHYRGAACASGRPFVHIYLTCSLDQHMDRLHRRAMGRVIRPKPEKLWENRKDKGKGKERELVDETPDRFPNELLVRLRTRIEAMDAEENKWLPVLFPAHRRKTSVGSSSTSVPNFQFRGLHVDTTMTTALETAAVIAGYLEDMRQGVKCDDLQDEDAIDGVGYASMKAIDAETIRGGVHNQDIRF